MIGVHGTRPYAMALAWQAARSTQWDPRSYASMLSFGRDGATNTAMGKYWVEYTTITIFRKELADL